MMDRYFCHLKFLPTFLIPSFHVGRSTDIPMGSPRSHLPDLPPLRPLGELGVRHNLISFGRGGCQCLKGHHCLGEEWSRAENLPNSCWKSPLAPPLLGIGLKTLLPSLEGVASFTAQLL